MSFPFFARLLTGILAPLLACSVTHAQIREEKPVPGLGEGVILEAGKEAFTGGKDAIPQKGRPGDKDFSIVIEAGIKELTDTALFWDFDGDAGWLVNLKADGSVEFVGRKTEEKCRITTPAHVVRPHLIQSIVISVRRNARQAESGIWIDGIEVASGTVPPEDCGGNTVHRSEITKVSSLHVRVYNRALLRPEILDLARYVSSNEGNKAKHFAPIGPQFIPQPDETIALIGGTEAVALAESGELEALLLTAFPQTRLHFRSLAWEGDTVFKQDRPMNFGSLEQQLRRVNAETVFLMFGRQECLDAANAAQSLDSKTALPEFKSAFEKLLTTVQTVTPRIVIIGPQRFGVLENTNPLSARLSEDNEHLSAYNKILREVSADQELVFTDVQTYSDDIASDRSGWFTDGVNLNSKGTWYTSLAIFRSLHLLYDNRSMQSLNNLLDRPEGMIAVGKALRAKNRLWHDYWRPSNWAFLHGDRTNQPSSRDPVNPQIRFFPAEQEKYLPLIKDAEDKVFQLVQEAQKKLP